MMKLETNHGEARFQEGSVSMPRARWMKRELDPRALQEENKRERLTPSKPIMERCSCAQRHLEVSDPAQLRKRCLSL